MEKNVKGNMKRTKQSHPHNIGHLSMIHSRRRLHHLRRQHLEATTRTTEAPAAPYLHRLHASELNRLNFQGFYTVLLERNEEQISVATIRVFGDKIAEVPLVGTRFQYRRLGMCRVLMDELEKKLKLLGVERLVLPAVPGVLETCTNSFGFKQMTNFERSKFIDYSFLDFQGTINVTETVRFQGTTVLTRLSGNYHSLYTGLPKSGVTREIPSSRASAL
ncbi:hypothetical protein RYX36_006871 [Vicia faba]